MITGDFLGMSLTTDNVRPSSAPNAWRIGNLTIAGVIMGIGELAFCVSILAFGTYRMRLSIEVLQTLALSSSCPLTRRRLIPTASAGTCGPRARASG